MTDPAALGISLSIDVGKGRNLVFQTHIPRDSNGLWDETLDRIMKAADRQMARCALDDLKHQRELRKIRLQNMMTDMVAIGMREEVKAAEWNNDERRRGPWKRSESEQKHHDELRAAMEREENEMKEWDRLLKEAEAAAA